MQLDFGKERQMTDENQNPGRKWRKLENEGDGDKYFDSYRYTPYTTDLEFYRDPNIYETEIARTTETGDVEPRSPDRDKPRGLRRTDREIKEEIDALLNELGQVNPRDVQVDVRDGIVTLSGNVSSTAEMRAAEGIARNVLGVLALENQLNMMT
jgi:hypothetical protein